MQAFLFDLDGTLVDSLEDIGHACNTILARYGYPAHPMQDFRRMVGRGFAHLVRAALPAEAVDRLAPEALTGLMDEVKAWYSRHMCERTRPYEGMVAALHDLAARGSVLAVLSNKPDELTVEVVRCYFPSVPFALVRGGRKGVPLKPDPAAPLDMLRQLGIAAAQAFYVGDSDVDILTARHAGMISVGVAWGFRGPDELRAARADHIVDAPSQLAALTAKADHAATHH